MVMGQCCQPYNKQVKHSLIHQRCTKMEHDHGGRAAKKENLGDEGFELGLGLNGSER